MLNLLVKYAYDHGLEAEPGFKPKDVRWAVSFATDGRYLGLLDFGQGGRVFPKSPDLSQPELKFLGRKPKGASKDDKSFGSHFLISECENVVLFAKEGEQASQTSQIKHSSFLDLLRRAGGVVPELALVARQLSDPVILTAIHSDLMGKKASPTQKMTVQFDQRFIVDETTWHSWWQDFRADIARQKSAKSKPGSEMICLATGESVNPTLTHPLVTGLHNVGGETRGTSFVSFDKQAFRSFGLNQSENGAVSAAAASTYRAALDALIKRGEVLAGMRVAYWFSHDVELENDPLSWLTVANEEQSSLVANRRARELLQSIRSGQRADLAESRFYALSLSGASARVMTRDWIEGAFEELVFSVEQWFSDLEIVNYLGTNAAKSPVLERVITCLLPPKPQQQDEKDWLKPVGSSRIALWKAALSPETPIPFSVVSRIVPLHRAFVLSGKQALVEGPEQLQPKKKQAQIAAISLLQARMGLLKAYHNRRLKGENYMQPYLNEEHPAKAYHCGRLMSVLARLQQSALGDVGAGIVQRYYGAASTTPALVLGRLTRLSNHHLSKLKPDDASQYEGKIASIWGRLKDSLPTTLTLEEQSLFALGYYQQMAHDCPTK